MTPEQIVSLVLFTSLTRAVVTAGLAAYAHWNRTYPGFGFWVAGNAVGSLGVLAVALRLVWPGASAIVGNFLVSLSIVLLLEGTSRFVRGRPLDRRWYALPAATPLVIALFLFGADVLLARLWWCAAYCCAPTLAMAAIWRRQGAGGVSRGASLLNHALAGVVLARTLAWTVAAPVDGLLDGGTREGIFFLAVGGLDLASQVVFLLANNQRLHAELRAANAELEGLLAELRESAAQDALLSGILPLCSCCRRIQEESGGWSPLEAYVSRRTEARFSHGLCRDCARRLYPGFADEA